MPLMTSLMTSLDCLPHQAPLATRTLLGEAYNLVDEAYAA